MKKLLFVGLAVLSLLIGVVALAHTEPALAASAKDEICAGVGAASGGSGCTPPKNSPTVNGVINTVINTLSVFVGIVAVIMIIFAGFKYVTSGGDSSKISSAKNALIYAVVGLVVAALAQVIVRFVVSRVL
ncbi:MAG TPA: pilin [Candidatus Saccharimonadales bacterium]|nr:pilin [Candidatus Saccharimonadales bacterium]